MNVAAFRIQPADETPASHAAEIAAWAQLDARSLLRLQEIARQYSRGTTLPDYNDRAFGELLYELKSARERFCLWDDLTILRAIKNLRDPTGW